MRNLLSRLPQISRSSETHLSVVCRLGQALAFGGFEWLCHPITMGLKEDIQPLSEGNQEPEIF
jgi:hypothetical protein